MNTFLSNLVVIIFFSLSIMSCASPQKIAYFNDIRDSARIVSKAGQDLLIQNKDILSISVSSLSNEATIVFNSPNAPASAGSSSSGTAQTTGYLVGEDGTLKFPILGNLQAAGLTQKALENNITRLLIDKKLLFDPIVTIRVLNFRVTVLGEVNRPGVINAPNEQLSILEAVGQAGDLTIYGLRNNVILIRQEGENKLIKRLNLNSSALLNSPYYYLKSNDVIYVEPGKVRVASADQTRQILPVILSSLSIIVVILTRIL